MEKIKVTKEQVLNFRANAEVYIGNNQGVFSRFIYALNKALKNTKDVFEKYNEAIAEIKYENAEKDEKTKHIKIDSVTNNFLFTKESRVEMDKATRKLLDEVVEVEQYLAKEIPDDLTVLILEVFCPFVLTEEDIENKFSSHEIKLNSNHKQ